MLLITGLSTRVQFQTSPREMSEAALGQVFCARISALRQ
jgi:hypothetical protein